MCLKKDLDIQDDSIHMEFEQIIYPKASQQR